MSLYRLRKTQPKLASLLEREEERGLLPQSLLFSGPIGASKLTGALDLAYNLVGEEDKRDTLTSPYVIYFPDRELKNQIFASINLYERSRTSATRLFLLRSVRLALMQYREVTPVTSTSESYFNCASDLDAFLLDYLKEREYSEKEVKALVSFLRKKFNDPRLCNGGKKNPTPVSIDSIRGIQDWFSSKSDKGKVAIFENIEDSTESAKNSLLKILEEPKPNTHIILISNKPQKIMETILSRVRKFDFPAIPTKTINEFLRDSYGVYGTYSSFQDFFFKEGVGEKEASLLEKNVSIFINAILSNKKMKKSDESSLIASLDSLSSYDYFYSRIVEELMTKIRENKISAKRGKEIYSVIEKFTINGDIYNMSNKAILDLVLREVDIVE